jgi:hypothetical protein
MSFELAETVSEYLRSEGMQVDPLLLSQQLQSQDQD